jgi:lysophospholipase L1-like esterase
MLRVAGRRWLAIVFIVGSLSSGSPSLFGAKQGASQPLHSLAPAPFSSLSPYRNYSFEHGSFVAKLSVAARGRALRNVGASPNFRIFLRKLLAKEPVTVVVFGGSITAGRGLRRWAYRKQNRYSAQLQRWLRESFPVGANHAKDHVVINKSVQATDSCYLSRILRARLSSGPDPFVESSQGKGETNDGAENQINGVVDLVLLEYAENDIHGPPKGGVAELLDLLHSDILACTEAVVRISLEMYPQAAIAFLAFSGWARRHSLNASPVHAHVASKYQLPFVSYGDALIPEFDSGAIPACVKVPRLYTHEEVDNDVLKLNYGCNGDKKWTHTATLDNNHPTLFGHKLITDLLAHLIQTEVSLLLGGDEATMARSAALVGLPTSNSDGSGNSSTTTTATNNTTTNAVSSGGHIFEAAVRGYVPDGAFDSDGSGRVVEQPRMHIISTKFPEASGEYIAVKVL